jgi:hypothetical protein
MTHVTLTSFRDAYTMDFDERWSGARWAPKLCADWPVAEWAQPMDSGGKVVIRAFGDGSGALVAYRDYLLDLYRHRVDDVDDWLDEVQGEVALCCWCPHTIQAGKQLALFGTFVCHLSVVRDILIWRGADVDLGVKHQEEMLNLRILK